ncbi:unnamed protein product [Brassica rapa subsp. trilocularis]
MEFDHQTNKHSIQTSKEHDSVLNLIKRYGFTTTDQNQ